MRSVSIRPQPAAVAAMSALAATAGETSSDEILVEQIAAGSKPAMQALFARHRTYVYRWLLRFVSNETLADERGFSRCVASGGSLPMPLLGLDVVNVDCSP